MPGNMPGFYLNLIFEVHCRIIDSLIILRPFNNLCSNSKKAGKLIAIVKLSHYILSIS